MRATLQAKTNYHLYSRSNFSEEMNLRHLNRTYSFGAWLGVIVLWAEWKRLWPRLGVSGSNNGGLGVGRGRLGQDRLGYWGGGGCKD